jgi:hypothetical protein
MKYLFTIAVAIGLASCGGTDECCDAPIIPTGDTLLSDSVYAANKAYQESLITKIDSVGDLLDTLENYEPKMTH